MVRWLVKQRIQKMNGFIIRIKNKLILAAAALATTVNVWASELPDSSRDSQIQDSLSKNKQYQKYLKTAKHNAPTISELNNKINIITLRINDIKNSFKQDKIANMNHKYTVGRFFLPSQIDLINRELSHEIKILTQTLTTAGISNETANQLIQYCNELLPITSKTTIDELRMLLVRLGLCPQQLPLYGNPVVVSSDKRFDLTNAMCWKFINSDKNNLYEQYKFDLKHLNDAPTNDKFVTLRTSLEKYQGEKARLSFAQTRATQIKTNVSKFFYQEKK